MAVGKLQRPNSSDFANVIGTGNASAQISVGRTIEEISLALGGTTFTRAHMGNIKARANGKVIIDALASEIAAINAYKGETLVDGFLTIPFVEMAGDTDFDREIGSFDTTMGIDNFTLEVPISGATAPTLKAHLIESSPQRQSANPELPARQAIIVAKLLPYPWDRSSGGRLPVSLPFGPVNGGTIKRIHVFHNGAVTGATVKHNGVVIHESETADNEQLQKRWGRVPQANVYTVDFMVDGKTSDSLITTDARSLELLLDLSGAETGRCIVEYLDPVGNL